MALEDKVIWGAGLVVGLCFSLARLALAVLQ
jgi:hypothetical protein